MSADPDVVGPVQRRKDAWGARDRGGLAELITAASAGDAAAWEAIVNRFTGLLISICQSHGLSSTDTLDVSQVVWLRLVEHLDRIREPDALPGWIATTARNESRRVVRTTRRHHEPLRDHLPAVADVAQDVIDRHQRAEVLEGLSKLGERCRELLALLTADPPIPYADIAMVLDMPIGSLGPTRARCLDHLRRVLHIPPSPKERT